MNYLLAASTALLHNPGLPNQTPDQVIGDVVKLLAYVAGVMAVIFIVVAGIRYITSDGNPDNIKTAKRTITYALMGLGVAVFAPAIVQFALSHAPSGNCTTPNNGSNTCIGPALQNILNATFYAAGLVGFVFVVIAGVKYITSEGNADRVQSAKKTITYAIIGMVIVMLADTIVGFVLSNAK